MEDKSLTVPFTKAKLVVRVAGANLPGPFFESHGGTCQARGNKSEASALEDGHKNKALLEKAQVACLKCPMTKREVLEMTHEPFRESGWSWKRSRQQRVLQWCCRLKTKKVEP